jgi:purine-binding chemotaxis protein CheW
MEISESQPPEDAEILESITEGIAAEIGAVDTDQAAALEASELEAQTATPMDVDEASSTTDELTAISESETTDDTLEVEPEKEISPDDDGYVDEDPVPVEEREPAADLSLASDESGSDEDQSDQPQEESTTTIDDEIEAAVDAVMTMDEEVEALPVPQEQHIIFTLAGTEYTALISNVAEIGYPLNVTPLPNVPEWVLGLANLRGDVISIVDLRAFLGLGKISRGGDARLLIAKTLQGDFIVGLIVESVRGIRYLNIDQIMEPPMDIAPQVATYVSGSYDLEGRALKLLNLERLLSSTEMRQLVMA